MRETLFIMFLLTSSILFISNIHGISILIIYISFYVSVIFRTNSDFLFTNIYIIFIVIISYALVMMYFSGKLKRAIISIQHDSIIINEQNEELKAINNDLKESQNIITTQNEELISLSENLRQQSDLIEIKNNELEEAIKAKNIFFSIIGHDLKSPLSSMTELT